MIYIEILHKEYYDKYVEKYNKNNNYPFVVGFEIIQNQYLDLLDKFYKLKGNSIYGKIKE
jgi:hypothetical protein